MLSLQVVVYIHELRQLGTTVGQGEPGPAGEEACAAEELVGLGTGAEPWPWAEEDGPGAMHWVQMVEMLVRVTVEVLREVVTMGVVTLPVVGVIVAVTGQIVVDSEMMMVVTTSWVVPGAWAG